MRRFAVLSFFWVVRAMAQYRPSKGLQKNRKETKALKKLVKYLNFTSFCQPSNIKIRILSISCKHYNTIIE